MFSDDDVAILDAIGEAAVPHLHVLLSEERRAKAMGRITHELKTPLVAIRSAAQMMRGEFERRRLAVDAFFGYDYVEDVWSWCELMRRLVGNAEFFRVGSGQLQVRAEKTYLMADVIAPAVRQVQVLLHERGFSSANIHYGRFEQIPRLWIDRNHFQQVMFNLLSNAVKYAFRDPAAFSIEIDGGRQRGNYVIWFRDWGTGIADGVEELIFEEGVRGPNAVATNVAGQGFGLWVVREVIEAHGGCIQVTRKTLPTEFTISLPEDLSRRGPDKHLGARREGS
jgi:signal transduction histidine kinase